MKRLIYSLFIIFSCSMSGLYAQNPLIRIDTLVKIPGDSISIPVYFANFTDIGSVTLYISFDNIHLRWGKGMNWLSEFSNGFNFANADNGIIAITCVNYDGVSLANGKLLDLRMHYSQGISTLNFVTGCEITDINGIPVDPVPVYISGAVVSPLDIALTAQRNPVCPGDTCKLRCNPTGQFGNYLYQWSSDPEGFSSTIQDPECIVTQTTVFFVTVTSGNTSDTGSITVIADSLPIPDPAVVIQPLPNSTGLLNPVTFSWQPASNAETYDIFLWQVGTTAPVSPTANGISNINWSPLNDLTEGKTYQWKIHTKNTCRETEGTVNLFTMLPLPDLHVSQLETSQPAAGQIMQLSWTVVNDGEGPTTTPLWIDHVWLSYDLDLGSNRSEDILLGQYQNVSALNPGESYTQTQDVVLPGNIYGNYFVFVVTDALDARDIEFFGPPPVPYTPPPYLVASTGDMGVVKEQDENSIYRKHDNFNYKPIFLTVPPVPDLAVSACLLPANTFSGQSILLNYTVTNQGEISALQNKWTDRIYISSDTSYNLSTAIPLKSVIHNGGLNLDSSYAVSINLEIPYELSGKYFIYIFIDANQEVFEYVYDGNNIYRSDTLTIFLTPPADLTVSGIIFPDTVSASESMPFTITVVNQGGSSPLVSFWKDYIYLSNSAEYDLSEAIKCRIISNNNMILSPGSSYTITGNLLIPGNLTGLWYIYVLTDAEEDVFEYNMNGNNLVRSDLPINILNPDLLIDPFSIPSEIFTDDAVLVQWQTRNQGPGNLHYSRWVESLFLSSESAYDPSSSVHLKSWERTKSIPVNHFNGWNDSIKLPDCNTGFYYLICLTDVNNTIYEPGNENNNITCSSSSIYVHRADLALTSLEIPFGAQSGEPVIIRSTIKNIGEGYVVNKYINNQVTISLTPEANHFTDRKIHSSVKLCNLQPGDSITYNDTIYLPPDLNGQWFLTYTTNTTASVKEGNATANNSMTSVQPLLIITGPMPDLQIYSVDLPDTVVAGIPVMTQFSIKNTGQKGIYGNPWTDKIHLSAISAWTPEIATLVGQGEKFSPLAKDEIYQVDDEISLSSDLQEGLYYFFIELDAGSMVYEAGGENNNLAGPYPVYIRPYPLDIAVTEAFIPSDTFGSGSQIQLSYKVQNISDQGIEFGGTWTDGVYLSDDLIWDPETDLKLGHWTITTSMLPNSFYYLTKNVQVPAGITGAYYLIAVCDVMQTNPDIDRNNNNKIASGNGQPLQPIFVQILPSPDFNITEIACPAQVFSGHNYTISWTVSNEGQVATDTGWVDKVYLSADAEVGPGDILLGSTSHMGTLSPGSSYSDSIHCNALTTISGNYYIIIKTDADNDYYEHLQEGNNIKTCLVFFRQSPPSDLIAGMPVTVGNGLIGEAAEVSWSVSNAGVYDLVGTLKDAVFLSTDSVYSPDDYRWFTLQGDIFISPGGLTNRDTVLPLPPITPGSYYLIIRTDISNAFQETDEINNFSTGGVISVNTPEIFLDIPVTTTLENLSQIFFRLEITDSLSGESLVLSLKGDSINGFNEIYAALNYLPDRINFDYQHSYTLQGNQDLFIPELTAGIYYFMVTGSTLPGQGQNLTLKAELLEFEIRRIEVDKGGVMGHVTVLITGSKFEPGMELYLARDSVIIPALIVDYINSTSLYATFQLFTTGYGLSHWEDFPVPKGYYDVVAIKDGDITAVLYEGFEVVDFQTPELLVAVDYPARVRSMNVFIMTISFTNMGNINLPVPRRILNSESEAPLALNSQNLSFNQYYLDLVFREPGGPEDVLRPGAVCSLKIYCRAMFAQSMHTPEETRIQNFRLLEE